MIGAIELRCAHFLLAIGAEDLELGEGGATSWRALFAVLSDGSRVLARGRLGETEIAELGLRIQELLRGERASVSFSCADGTFYLAMDRRSETELGVAVRLVTDRARGAYSCAETRAARTRVAELASSAASFPY